MAAPRTTRPKTASSDKPAPIAVNLDTLELETTDVPFVAVVGGKNLTFKDPKQIFWQDLMGLDDPESFAEIALEEAERDHFLETRVETGKVMRLMSLYRAHYGMGDPGNLTA